jgi:site-specific recombinase XerD
MKLNDYGYGSEEQDFGYTADFPIEDVAWLLPKGQVKDLFHEKMVELVRILYKHGLKTKEIAAITKLNLRTIQRYVKCLKKGKRQCKRLYFNNIHQKRDNFSKSQTDRGITNNG